MANTDRKGELHLIQVTEAIHDDGQCNKIRMNSIDFHLIIKGNSSGIVLHPHNGPQNPSKFDLGRNRASD